MYEYDISSPTKIAEKDVSSPKHICVDISFPIKIKICFSIGKPSIVVIIGSLL